MKYNESRRIKDVGAGSTMGAVWHPWVRGTPVPNSMFHRGHRGWVFDVSKKEVSGE